MIWPSDFNLDLFIEFDLVLDPYLEKVEKIIDEYERMAEVELLDKIRNAKIVPIDYLKDHDMEKKVLALQMFMFRRIMRYSFVTLLYSSVEVFAMRMCESHAKKHSQKNLVSDNSWRNTPFPNRVEKYLHKAVNMPTKSMPREISNPIDDMRKVRNCITHCGGFIKYCKNREDLRQLVCPGYKVNKAEIIILESEYCEYALEKTKEFLTTFNQLLTD